MPMEIVDPEFPNQNVGVDSSATAGSMTLQDNRPQQEDYFGFSHIETFLFPDGITYFEFKTMNEGQKADFQKLVQKDLIMERQSGNARMKLDPAQERHALINMSVTGWNMIREGAFIPFSQRAMNDFLKLASPKLVEDIEKAIRKANPWMLSDMSTEDIDREIENLQEMRKVAEERERGE